jgi:hypothetical protein
MIKTKGKKMKYLTTPQFHLTPFGGENFQWRFGSRAISISKDFRKRFYHTHPILECHAGTEAGHLEILLFRSWLIVFSKA